MTKMSGQVSISTIFFLMLSFCTRAQLSDTLPTVIISAHRYDQQREKLPVSVTTISGDELQKKNLPVDKAIERTVGVAVVDGEIQIRGGSGWSYGAGSRTAVLLDGLPLLSGDALRPSWGLMPNEAIGQVEIIKGPGSVQYGSSALSGVVYVQTMWPGEKPFTRINAQHGIYSSPQTKKAKYWKGNLMGSSLNALHTRKINHWDLVMSLNAVTSDGYLGPMPDSASGAIANKYNPFTIDKFDASKNVRARVATRYHFQNVKGLIVGASILSRYAESVSTLLWANDSTGLYQSYTGATTPGQQFFLMGDGWLSYRVSEMAKHQLKYRWLNVNNGFDNNQDSYTNNHTVDYSVQLKMDSIGLTNMKIIPGFYTTIVDSKGGLYTAADASGHNASSNIAAFIELQKTLWDKLNISTGMRYESYWLNSEKFSKPVFHIGANYELNSKTFLRSNFGQGFRFPTIAERYTKTNVGRFNIFPNPELQPETSESFELGVIRKWSKGKWLFDMDASIFRQNFSNYIEYNFGQWLPINSIDDFTNAFGFKTLNTGNTRSDGFELVISSNHRNDSRTVGLQVGYNFSQPISLQPDYKYAEGMNAGPLSYSNTSSDPGGNILKYRIRHSVRCQADWEWKNWSASFTLRFNSFMENIDDAFNTFDEAGFIEIIRWRNNHNRGDFLMDASFGYEISNRLQCSVFVFNLTNYEYMSRPLQIEPGRLSQLRLTYQL